MFNPQPYASGPFHFSALLLDGHADLLPKCAQLSPIWALAVSLSLIFAWLPPHH